MLGQRPVKHFIGIFLLLLFSCSSCNKKEKEKEKGIAVTTTLIEPKTIPVDFDFVGVTQSSHLVEIRSRVEGYLKKIAYREGSFVKEGDLLFEIDPAQFEVAVKEAQATLEREKASLWMAQKAVDRYKPLFEQRAASRKDLDDATAQLLGEQAAVSFYQAKVDEADLNLSYTKIVSPISGVTTNSKYREGTLISPGANGYLTTVSVIDPIWVVIGISDYYFLTSKKEIAKGELIVPEEYNFDVTLELADGSSYPHHGKVSFVSPVLDPDTGTLSARGIFPNPDSLLKPGQFVRVTAHGAIRPNAIFVPQESVQEGERGRFVYVVNEKRQVEMRLVQTGEWYESYWIIKSGLKAGDEVVVAGVSKLKPGGRVNVIKRV